MPIDQVLGILIAERDRLSRAIEALQGPVKRRGRPPKLMEMESAPPSDGLRRGRTPAQRRAQSEKMKKYWALRRKLKE